MRQNAAGREVQGIVAVALFGGRLVAYAVKPGTSARRWEAIGEQARRARVAVRGAGPENAVFRVDAGVGHAGVVSRTAGGGAAQFVEHVLTAAVRKTLTDVEARGQRAQHVEIRPSSRGRFEGAATQDDASLQVRHRAVLFGP